MKTLKNLFLEELRDRYDSEKQFVQILPKMVITATCSHLKKLLQPHIKETENQIAVLEKVFAVFEENPHAKKCQATIGLIKEYEETSSHFKGTPTINAALIGIIQKIKHYEMVSYGCLSEWASVLDNKKASNMLQANLDEEGTMNKALTELAKSQSNQEALGVKECKDTDSMDSACSIKEDKKHGPTINM